ncbi:alpha/beta hydrolase [Mediterraneibacter massiliensis]|uniref:alpha/beta hydrolase n=1 Tax=Mediterraneibacter massiliensis TaxID=1720300 RepID=UPI0024ADBB58|nr:alpha/beta hydrolase [Mediterraneibacter massiliensis]
MRCNTIAIKTKKSSQAELHTYILDNYEEIDASRKRPMIVICPGGGYRMTSDREAEAVAIQYTAMGYHACVLKYSVKPAEFPQALCELAWSMAYLRGHAQEYGIDKDKMIVLGFSAGGHLAASLGVFWNKEWLEDAAGIDREQMRPNGMILSYPVILYGAEGHTESFENLLGTHYTKEKADSLSLEKQVSADTPPTFLWHTYADETVPVENTLFFAEALQRAKISMEVHIFPHGPHGLSLANEETQVKETGFGIQKHCQDWLKLSEAWLKELEK